MPCYHPLTGYKSRVVNPTGKRSIVFDVSQGFRDMPVELPCGQCIGCRLERSRQWAVRCMHEASVYRDNCWITLTYDPKFLPKDCSLNVKHFQDFFKRLRRKFGSNIRFFHCGEYGDEGGRPHYHACVFNFDFPDRRYWKSVNGYKYYVSQELNDLWGMGHTCVGDLTFETAAYTARYIMKKVTGKNALHHYNNINLVTGEIVSERRPEYVTMSRRPGIGRGWFDRFYGDIMINDSVVVKGKEMSPPKFYFNQFEVFFPSVAEDMKFRRLIRAKKNKRDRYSLDCGEVIKKHRTSLLKRGFENGP